MGPRECRRAPRWGSQAAATVSTTSHVITFCLVRASSRRKVQLSLLPPTPPHPGLAQVVSVKFSTDERLSSLSGVIRPVGAKSARSAAMVSVSLFSLSLSLFIFMHCVSTSLHMTRPPLCSGSWKTTEALSWISVIIQPGASTHEWSTCAASVWFGILLSIF